MYGNKFEKRKNGVWSVRKSYGVDNNGKRIIKRFSGNTKKEVIENMRKFERRELHLISSIKDMTLLEYLEEWAEVYKKNSVKPKTYEGIYNTIHSRIAPYSISRRYIGDITTNMLQCFFNELRDKGYARATIKRTYETLNNCFCNGILRRELDINPLLGIELPSEDIVIKKERQIHPLSAEDVVLIEKEVYNPTNLRKQYSYGEEVLFLLYTGIRIGEASALIWEDIDWDRHEININKTSTKIKDYDYPEKKMKEYITTPKTKNSRRTLYLSQKAYYVLQQIFNKATLTGPKDRVFQTSKGKPADRNNIRRCLNSIQKNAHTTEQNSGLHVLRHSFATLLSNGGIEVQIISSILGHSKVSTTYNTYIHPFDPQRIDAMKVIDDVI